LELVKAFDRPENASAYFELYGETSPLVDEDFAELLPSGAPADGDQASPPQSNLHIYEYWWTLGVTSALQKRFREEAESPHLLHGHGDQATGAQVDVYFPTDAGWRVKELVATLKYLSPIHIQQTFGEKLAKEWALLSPLLSAAGGAAGLLAPGAPVAVDRASKVLTAVAGLKLESAPQTDDLKWWVTKVTPDEGFGSRQGVRWTVPARCFVEIGTRVTASVAVSFIPSPEQGEGAPQPAYKTSAIRGSVKLFPDGDGHHRIPGEHEGRDFIALDITPKTTAR